MSDRLSHALEYARRGWRIVPLHNINGGGRCTCLREPCNTPAKHPRIKGWPEKASSDEKTIRAWWARWPEANVGVATGGGLADIETEGHGPGADNLDELERKLGPLPDTVSWTSGGGGMHRLFRTSIPVRSTTSIGREVLGVAKTGIDVRGEGGLAVLPPSNHVSGSVYRWGNLAPEAIDVAELPEAWAEYLAKPSALLLPAADRPIMTAEELQAAEARALAYLAAMPEAVSGRGGHSATYAAATVLVHGFGLPPERALSMLLAHYNDRCRPPWTEKELRHKVEDAARNQHDQPYCWLRENGATGAQPDISGLLAQFDPQEEPKSEILLPPTLNELIATYPDLRKPVIHGLLREGETMNLISAPKIGKTWLGYALVLATAAGEAWLGEFPCAQGQALLVDNELHPETAAHRIPKVASAMGLDLSDVGELLRIESCRGRLMDLTELGRRLKAYGANAFKLVVLDAFYRFLPKDTDENDNAAMARLYNTVDQLAGSLRCAFVLVHHTSKGLQGHKSITDVGAGAGAQSRAADTHVILRKHEEPQAAVFDAAVRSWPPVKSFCLRWQYPIWTPTLDLDPADVESPYSRRRSKREKEPTEPSEPPWTPERLVESFLTPQPQAKELILMFANEEGLSDHKAEKLLRRAIHKELVYRWKLGGNASAYATEPQPELPLGEDSDAPKAEQVLRLLNQYPDMSHRAIARQCGTFHSYVSRLAKRLEKGFQR